MIKIALVLVGVIGAFGSALFLFQSKILFYPETLKRNFIFSFDIPFEEKFISYGESKEIHGLLFKPSKPAGRILYFHGNGGALDSWGFVGAELAKRLNYEVFILDYPGYGKSSGGVPTTEQELFESAEAAFKELNENADTSLPLILYGRSLGSGVASFLATRHKVNALILETPYTSIKNMAAKIFPFAPSFLVRYDLDNLKNIKGLDMDILILHGTADQVVPYVQAQELAKVNPKTNFVTFDGGGHNNLSEFPKYWPAVEALASKLSQSGVYGMDVGERKESR